MSSMREAVARDRAYWLLDAVATATQDRRFLRGDPEYDEVAGGAILANGKKAIVVALAKAMQPEIDRRVAEERAKLLKQLRGLSDELEDDFTDAIGDSLDVDWRPRDGARNCVIAFNLTLAQFEKENSDG